MQWLRPAYIPSTERRWLRTLDTAFCVYTVVALEHHPANEGVSKDAQQGEQKQDRKDMEDCAAKSVGDGKRKVDDASYDESDGEGDGEAAFVINVSLQ